MSGWDFSMVPHEAEKVETKHRRIVTAIPVPESLDALRRMEAVETRAMHGQMPVIWDRASGFQVYDEWGNQWIDFTSTIFVANAGHANPRILEALKRQCEKPLLHTYTYANMARVDYLEYLLGAVPAQFEKAFLLSAGTEATECALKLMRLNAQAVGKRRPGIICFEGNWHGRTLGAQLMSHNKSQKAWVGYEDPNIFHLPFPYPWREEAMEDPAAYFERSMDALLKENGLDPEKDLCGFMLETFQGWGAVFYPESFVKAVEAYARRHGMLMAFDEMQAGFGRTGTLFGYEHYGVEPDILCCGKGSASGAPLSIVLGSAEVMDLPDVGSMSSTHSANPLVCAVGHANLEALLKDGMIDNSRELGEILHAKLNAFRDAHPDRIAYVMGKGLLAAIHVKGEDGEADALLCSNVCEEAMRRGLLLVHTGRESIKLAPPLCITREALEEGLDVMFQCFEDCF